MQFNEVQRFNQWWLWLGIVGGFVGPLTGLYYAGQTTHNYEGIFIAIPIYFGLVLLLVSINLKTHIGSEGIKFKLFPFQFNWKVYNWADLQSVEVRSYDPLGEYGGWGLKGSSKNRAYNISGTDGIQLELINGKRVLIGTRQPEMALKIINHYFEEKRPEFKLRPIIHMLSEIE